MQPRPLPPGVAAEIRNEGGDDAEALIEIATSPRYGAPAGPPEKDSTQPEGPPAIDALDAVVSPVAEADETRLVVLVALLAGMTLLGFTFAAKRHRR